jgi:hypothetical protein
VSVVLPGSVGGGESRMCSHAAVCNRRPADTTTPVIARALTAVAPRARYAVGPCTAPLLGTLWQLPSALALALARPTPDWLVDALMRLVPHPMHS